MQLSIIIPSYNSWRTLSPCLAALHPQLKRLNDLYEVIVVDSSEDGTERSLGREFPWVRVIHLPQKTEPGRGRNIGVEQSTGDLLVFLDADCIPEPQWLERMMERQEENCIAVGGSLGNGNPDKLIGWASYLLEFSEWLPGSPARVTANIPTANISYKRKAFDQYGLFPLDVFPSEDWVFNRRLVDGGEEIRFDPRIRVRHVNKDKLGTFYRHQRLFGTRSALAHAQYDMKDSLLLRFPFLSYLLPLFRSLTVTGRVIRGAPRNIPVYLLVYPVIFGGLVVWSAAFHRSLVGLRRSLEKGINA